MPTAASLSDEVHMSVFIFIGTVVFGPSWQTASTRDGGGQGNVDAQA